MISMASRNAFGSFTFAAFSAKNIPVAVAVMFFFNQNYSFMCIFFSPSYLKHITSFLWFMLLLFFVALFFICSLRRVLVIYKKYTSTYGQNSNYTNVVDISITRSCAKKEEVEGV